MIILDHLNGSSEFTKVILRRSWRIRVRAKDTRKKAEVRGKMSLC